MRFEWDEHKNESNIRKHGVSFKTASFVFDDPRLVMQQDREIEGEPRWQTIGIVHGVLLLLVAHTYADEEEEEAVRIISARRANAHERKRYEEEL